MACSIGCHVTEGITISMEANFFLEVYTSKNVPFTFQGLTTFNYSLMIFLTENSRFGS